MHKSSTCLAQASCHTYKSKTGKSSARTRVIAEEASRRAVSASGKKGNKQRYRENKKRRCLWHLEEPEMQNKEEAIEAVMEGGRKVYIAGIAREFLPTTLPYNCIKWSVSEQLVPFLNRKGNGCRAGNYYTLLPREWILKCFPNTDKFFRLFMKILELHPRIDPRGDKKVPVYDRGSPGTYVVVGTSARRSGRGLQLVDRRLKEASFQNERSLLRKYFRQVAYAAYAYLDTPSIRYLNVVKEMTEFSKFSFDHPTVQSYGRP